MLTLSKYFLLYDFHITRYDYAMHELSVTANILEIASRHGEDANATKITDLYLVIGALSSIVDDSVQFYWDTISSGTLCEGSTLHFDRIPAQLLCLDCNESYKLTGELATCPNCDSSRVKVQSGNEFYLDRIEISFD
ncbi:MAG: hydrogenase maturation nickel metallochaperone HypA [Chloroflexi bacterium]|nr:MAG: hydrogenase maturation nickel metallochaperone HypA [Chloroflexota bacterium]